MRSMDTSYSLENLALCQDLVHLFLGGDFCLRDNLQSIQDSCLGVNSQHHLHTCNIIEGGGHGIMEGQLYNHS